MHQEYNYNYYETKTTQAEIIYILLDSINVIVKAAI